jgi:acyl-CoA thioesterase-2
VNDASGLLARNLDLQAIDDLRFEGCASGQVDFGLYGGHLLGQGVAAVHRTVEAGRQLHSVHAYFLRGGDGQQPVEYVVELVRDGRAFCTRRAVAWQNGKPIFELLASFHSPEEGSGEYAAEMPTDAGDPETSPTFDEVIDEVGPVFGDEWSTTPKGFEVRIVHAPWAPSGGSVDGGIDYWFRVTDPLPEVPGVHEAVLAYVSDDSIADNTLAPFGRLWGGDGVVLASLDHAMWFHRPADTTEWMFASQRPVSVSGSRGLAEMKIWSQSGLLVASAAQEALVRF